MLCMLLLTSVLILLMPLWLCSSLEVEDVDIPNTNNFSPCSSLDRKCLQKQQARTRERINSGVKMRSNGNLPLREDIRPVVRCPDFSVVWE